MASSGYHAPYPQNRPPRQRKGSNVVALGTIGALSVVLIGFCAAQNSVDDVTADCVDLTSSEPDGSYAVVGDDYCDDDGGVRYFGSRGAYGWYYGGRRAGTRVSDGTTSRPPDANITSRGGREIQRGGFGGRGYGGG